MCRGSSSLLLFTFQFSFFLCVNSSVGRAQPCQGWGREFESRFPLLEIHREMGFHFFCIYYTQHEYSDRGKFYSRLNIGGEISFCMKKINFGSIPMLMQTGWLARMNI